MAQRATDDPSPSAHDSEHDIDSVQSKLMKPTAQVDAAASFKSTRDYFEFARLMADAAVNGDATAAYYLSIVLENCRSFVGLLKHASGLTEPQAALAAFQATIPGLLPEDREKNERHLERCSGFFNGDPLDGYSRSVRYRSAAQWLKLAYEGGDAAATADYLVRAAVNASDAAERHNALTQPVRLFVQQAIASKNPRSIAAVGRLLMHPDFSSNPIQGLSWIMAACNLGYDCSSANREMGLPCTDSDTCDPQQSVADFFRDGFGPERFAQAYTAAQQIEFSIQSGDSRMLARHLPLTPP